MPLQNLLPYAANLFFFHAPGRTNFCKPLAKNRKKKKKKTLIFFLHLWLYALVEQLSWKIFFPAESTRCPSSCWMVVYCMIVLLLLLLYPADWPWSQFFPCRNNLQRLLCLSFASENGPTGPFTIWMPQHQQKRKFYWVRDRLATDFEATKLCEKVGRVAADFYHCGPLWMGQRISTALSVFLNNREETISVAKQNRMEEKKQIP